MKVENNDKEYDFKKKCTFCKKKECKFVMMKKHQAPTEPWYGFCSKVCIANRTIKHYDLKKVV